MIKRVNSDIKIDGILDEPFWDDQNAMDLFINQWPVDSGLAVVQTSVKLAFDDQFLYVGATCYDVNNKHIIRTLKRDRDDDYFGSDALGIVLDPVNKRSNGFFFGVNAGGAQIEALIRVNGSSTDLDQNWDNKWFSEISLGDSVWFVEMAIPFRSLRYDPDNKTWGINFVRNDMKLNTYSSWNQVPVNLNTIDLGYTGLLQWETPPPKIKNGAVNLIPYVSGNLRKDYEQQQPVSASGNIGIDAKVALNSSLNLDLTINPDFSTVDVDVQQTNLTRFSLFFPERRAFFLENNDLFSFGKATVNPFFSRRIGLVNGEAIPINFGARLTGNVSENIRVGIMNIQTGSSTGINAQNYTVGSIHRRIGQRSTIKGLFVNRQTTSSNKDSIQNSFNRIGGFEVNLLTPDGKWGADVGIEKSFNPIDLKEEEFYSATVRHNSKNLFASLTALKIGKDFLTDVGFVPRLTNYDAARDTTIRRGYTELAYFLVYNFFPKSDIINIHGPRLSTTVRLNPNGTFNETYNGIFYYINFKNQSDGEINVTRRSDNLPFDSFIVGDIPFPQAKYKYTNVGFFYRTNPRKRISSFTSSNYGGFYDGDIFSVDQRISYRVQPWGNFSLTYSLNDIRLPENLQSTTLHLVGTTTEISFSNKMFWTTFLQFNTQSENFNINSRFQWKYRPMSDLFIVYSENYATQNLNVKNRGIVIKLTYWI
ncbi:MAG: DUF5916 domain-containing protein [Cyclobacteriaceae bacterium]